MTPLQHTSEVIKFLKTQTSEVCLFYSGGKDSIVLLDLLSHYFTVHLVFMYYVKGLDHIEKYLIWAKRMYKVNIIQYPHWMLSYDLNAQLYRFPSKEMVPHIRLTDVAMQARIDTGTDWVIFGMKKNDSLDRRLMLNTFFMSAINLDSKFAYPLANWSDKLCLAYIRHKRLAKPINYGDGKRSSGMALDPAVLTFLRDKYPDDYSKIIEQFPFAETLAL